MKCVFEVFEMLAHNMIKGIIASLIVNNSKELLQVLQHLKKSLNFANTAQE